MVRSSLVAAWLVLAAGACAPPTAPAAQASGPVAPTTSPDDMVRSALARLPAAGPLEQALRQANREELSAALAALTPAQKADHRSLPLDAGASALVRAALDPGDQDALAALCCGGRAVRSLAVLRGRGSRDDLPSTARSVSQWAARALGNRLAVSGHGPLEARELDWVALLAHVLDEAELRAVSRSQLATLEPSPGHVTNAAASSARALAVADARRWLEVARRIDPGTLDPQLVPAIERLVGLAEQLRQLGGAEASGDDALAAAVLAARLDRLSLAGVLLQRSGVAPGSDLRAAVVAAAVQGDGSLCQGLERSREPSEVCPLAWRTTPAYHTLTALLDRGLASGRGREAWTVEASLGLGHVIPVLYEATGGALTPEQFLAHLDDHFGAIERGLALGGLDETTRSALALYASTLRLVFQQLVQGEPQRSVVDEVSARGLLDRASELLGQAPGDPLVGQVVMAVVMVAPRSPAVSALLGRVSVGGPAESTRAALAVVLGPRELTDRALPGLLSPPAWLPVDVRAQDRLLAREAMVELDPTPAPLEALDAQATAPATTELEPVERLRRRLDHSAALARLGRREEAETALVETIEQVPAAGLRDPAARDLLRVAETEAAQLLATGRDAAAQRAGVARLRDRLTAPPAARTPAPPCACTGRWYWRACSTTDARSARRASPAAWPTRERCARRSSGSSPGSTRWSRPTSARGSGGAWRSWAAACS